METVILITLLVMCVIIVFILADHSWFKWDKMDQNAYVDEDEIEEEFDSLEACDRLEECDKCPKKREIDQEE